MKNSTIVEIFNKFRDDPKMHKDYYLDGCIYRTRKICDYILKDKKFKGEPIIFVRISPIGDRGKIICKTPCYKKPQSDPICWNEHWIPLVKDENNANVVLDVCLMDGPERLTEYMQNFINAEIKKSDICNARNELDYNLFIINSRSEYDLEITANNPENDDYKISPNTVQSNWLRKYEENRLRNMWQNKWGKEGR